MSDTLNQPESLPRGKKILYSLGQFGWSLMMGLISTWLIWYYNPPDVAGLAIRIPQGAFIAGLTVIGVISALGRLLDAITDPWIATLSDRLNHPKGRRIPFMRWGAIPAAVLGWLTFVSPIAGESLWNVAFLTLTLLGFYVAFTMYVTPYFALVSEFGHSPEEKLDLSTYISLTWFLGFAVATLVPSVWGMFEQFMDRNTAVQAALALFAGVALIFMLLPAYLLDEKRYSHGKSSDESVWKSLAATFRNKNFRVFVISDLVYWFSLTIFQTGIIYFVTVLLVQPEQTAGLILPISGVLSFLCYPAVNLIAKKTGKKRLMIIGFVLFTIAFIYTAVVGSTLEGVGIPLALQAYLIALLTGIPLAIFGILPNAIVADVAEYDGRLTGQFREGMFFGARTFVQKLGQSLGLLIFSSFLLLGRDVGDDWGIRLAALAAAVLMLGSGILFIWYKEREVLAGIRN